MRSPNDKNDFEKELRDHLELEAEEQSGSGVSEREARERARRAFGNATVIAEEVRAIWRSRWLEDAWQDIRYALRMLRKTPGFTTVAVLTLALGIGANTAIFSVVDAVLLRPLPFRDASRLVWAFGKFPLGDSAGVTPPAFRDYRASAQTFEQFAAKAGEDAESNIAGGDKPELVRSLIVSWNFFDAFGVHPLYGRTFVPEDEQVERPQVAILGNGIWKRAYASDPDVVGKKIIMDGVSTVVVGVLPVDLPMISKAEIWRPIPMVHPGMNQRTAHFLYVIGRLRPGVRIEEARSELDAIAGKIASQYPGTDKGWSLRVTPLTEQIVGGIRLALLLMFGAVGLLLVIACINVANLLLARATTRRKEIAIRSALGAGRGRILRQMLTESLLLAAAGGGLGILGAIWGGGALRSFAPVDLPRLNDIQLNGAVLTLTIAVTLATGFLFGLAPALQMSRGTSQESLKEGGKTAAAGIRHRMGSGLVIGEVAISVTLLIVGGLLVESFWRLIHVNPGFQADHVLTGRVNLPGATYPKSSQKAEFLKELEDRLGAMPGVLGAGAISELPLSGQYGDNPFTVVGRTYAPSQMDDADSREVSLGYFHAMRIPLLVGRWFDTRDTAQAAGVVVVNDAFAKRFFPDRSAIGERLDVLGDQLHPREIVGVVGTVSHYRLGEAPRPEFYVPFAQYPYGGINIVVRSKGDPDSLVTTLRDAVRTIDKDEAVSEIQSMDAVLNASVGEKRFSAMLLGLFAGLALLLAAVGLYTVIAFTVTQRTHEIGIRMAFGAAPPDIRRMVLGRGMKLTLAGAGIGFVGGFGLARMFRQMLFGIGPSHPATYIGVTALLITVAIVASFVPAWHATRVNPLVALRYE